MLRHMPKYIYLWIGDEDHRKLHIVVFSGLIVSLLLISETFATTEFYLFPSDVEKSLHCSFMLIQNNQVLCSQDNIHG